MTQREPITIYAIAHIDGSVVPDDATFLSPSNALNDDNVAAIEIRWSLLLGGRWIFKITAAWLLTDGDARSSIEGIWATEHVESMASDREILPELSAALRYARTHSSAPAI